MKAVIVAAGESKRLRPLTDELPKCMLPVEGKPIIERSIDILRDHGISEIGLVVGYLKEKIISTLGQNYTYIFNPFYSTTNNMASLWFAKHFIDKDSFVYLHADLMYHPDILHMTLRSDAEIALAVEETECDDEMMKVKVEGDFLVESSKDVPNGEAFGEWTGIAKFSNTGWVEFAREIEQLLSEGFFNSYDTHAMNRLAARNKIIQIVCFQNLPFIEIDFKEDLDKARGKIIENMP